MRPRRHAVFLCALLLASCGSSPKTHYFTLAAVNDPREHELPVASPVMVAEVHLPRSLDRREMVRRTGENTVEISDQDRWSAPFGDMIQRVLSEDLAARLPSEKVVPPGLPPPPLTERIVVAITQFGPDRGRRMRLDGSWSLLKGPQGTPVLQRQFALETESKSDGADGDAAAMSELLAELASSIAATLAQRPAQAAAAKSE
jgi:uncharacterized lipoprotein YmbA